MSDSDIAGACLCGLPLSANPHPLAGQLAHLCTVGAVFECIPCLVGSRHKASRRADEAERGVVELQLDLAAERFEPIGGDEYGFAPVEVGGDLCWQRSVGNITARVTRQRRGPQGRLTWRLEQAPPFEQQLGSNASPRDLMRLANRLLGWSAPGPAALSLAQAMEDR